MKKNFFKEHYSVFGYSAIIVICVFLMFSAVLLAGQHSASLEEQAVTRVEGYSHDTSEILTRKIDSLTSAATYICEDIAVCRTEREIRAVFNNASSRAGMESLLFIRFFYDGTEFTAEGSPYTLREADAILREEFDLCGLNEKVWQYFVVVPDIKSVGVKNESRYEGWPAIIRAVNTTDAMTATVEEIPYEVLHRITARITSEVEGINRVLMDLTPKPIGTIEWE